MNWRGDPLLFLDIDGVVNRHKQHPNGYCGLEPECVAALNAIMDKAKPYVVLVSAWRYLLLTGDMNIDGFNSMLLTHGLARDCIHDYVGEDVFTEGVTDRARGIDIWYGSNKAWKPAPYLVIDDLDLGYSKAKMNYWQTDSKIGLRTQDVEPILERLQ